MINQFQNDIESLRLLPPDDLYQTFHKIQSGVLRPKWTLQLNALLSTTTNPQITGAVKIKETFAPRAPEVPGSFLSSLQHEIATVEGHDVLFLNCALSCVEDRVGILDLAKRAGFKFVVLKDVPRDGTFHYESFPEVTFFTERNEKVKAEFSPARINRVFEQAMDWCQTANWQTLHDIRLGFIYETDFEKQSLVKMKLGLDLIEHRFAGTPSRFDELKAQLTAWYHHPGSRVRVQGCSRWLLLAPKQKA